MLSLSKFLPVDRRLAYLRQEPLPERVMGAVLLSDISGSMRLIHSLAEALGQRRGAEEMTRQLNLVYTALIDQVHQYRGSVIGFSGDGLTCWFDGDDGWRAVSCAQTMQMQMAQFANLPTPLEKRPSLGLKTAVAVGPAHRFVVGDPQRQQYDLLGGETVVRAARAESVAQAGELLVDETAVANLKARLTIDDWRPDASSQQRFANVARLLEPAPLTPWSFQELHPTLPPTAVLPPWTPPAVAERLASGQANFLAEVRPVTALFYNFANLDYDHDPAAPEQLRQYVGWAQAVASQYESDLIDITISDGGVYLYLAFGAPIAHDDDAARAIAAAGQLLQPPPAFSGIQRARVGLAAGQMRAGAYGSSARMTYGVLGDAANLAARLVALTPPGKIYSDYETFHVARRRWAFIAHPPVRVKGKVEMIRIYEPIGQPAGDRAALPSEMEQAVEIIGREAEVAHMTAVLDNLAQGRGGVLFITGEAGIGKTRLMGEAARLIRERGFVALVGYGSSIERQTPYRVWRDIMRSYFELDSFDDPQEQERHVERLTRLAAPEQLERLPLLNDILSLNLPETRMMAELDPALRQQNVIVLIQALLQAWAERRPLTLALEDGQWVDTLSWELTLQVVRRMQTARLPFLLLVAQRPLSANAPGLPYVTQLQQLNSAENMALSPLSPAEIDQLLRDRFQLTDDGLPAEISQLIVERAEGNPFYAEELALNLLAQNIVRLLPVANQPGHYRSELAGAGRQTRPLLPDTLQGLILARIDRLPTHRQLILKVAAVIGRLFPIRLLHQTLSQYQYDGMSEADLRDHLAALARQRIVEADPADPEHTYLFQHSIIQAVAYQTLLQAQRQELHRFVAEWYEAIYSEGVGWQRPNPALETVPAPLLPHLPLLVHHYQRAGDVDREQMYARLAGLQAARQYAHREAVNYLSAALSLTPADQLENQFELLLARQTAYSFLGHRLAQAEDLRQLSALADLLADKGKAALIALQWARHAELTGEYETAVTHTQQAIAQANAVGNVSLLAQSHYEWGMALMRQSRYVEAQAQFEWAIAHARLVAASQIEASALRAVGIICAYQGDYRRGYTLYDKARQIFHALGDRAGEVRCYSNMATARQYLGDYTSSLELERQGLALAEQIGDRYWESGILGNMGRLYAGVGLYDLAEKYLRQSLAIDLEIGARANQGLNSASLAALYLSQDRCEEARVYAQQATAIGRKIGSSQDIANGLHSYADALLCLGRLPEALTAFTEAADIREAVGQMGTAVESWAGLALVYQRLGETAVAHQWAEQTLPYLLERNMDGAEEIFDAYGRVYRVLLAANDKRAAAVLAIGEQLLQEQAARITDKTMRRSFLQRGLKLIG